jgi:hypothetical protein
MSVMAKNTFKTIRKERPLSNQDCESHLLVRERVSEPHASAMVIRMNSTYLELVDGLYANRGGMSAFGTFAVVLSAVFLMLFFYSSLFDFYLNPNWDHQDESEMLWSTAFSTVLLSMLIVGAISVNRKIGEWFGYTHYPIRLNRRNRMVYVFRGDGTVLQASWDKVYFTLHVAKKVAGTSWLGISGLVLKDPETIEETFMFGYSSSEKNYCLRHWEFMRRYMEEGPQSVIDAPGLRYCLPIADKRETLHEGWIALVSNDAWNPVVKWLMLPFHVLFFIGRLVCRVTSKVPLWPADAEAACSIAPGDPYVRDSSTNPAGYR